MFKATYKLLEILRRNPGTSYEEAQERMDQVEIARSKAMVASFEKLAIPHADGWLDIELRHIRNMVWDDDNFCRCPWSLQETCRKGRVYCHAETLTSLQQQFGVCRNLPRLARKARR